MEIRDSKSVSIDLYFHELGVLYRALDFYSSNFNSVMPENVCDLDELRRAQSMKLNIYRFLNK